MPDQSTAKQRLADPPGLPPPSRCFDVSHVSCCLSPPPFGFGRFGFWRFYTVPPHGTTAQFVKTKPFGTTAQNPVRPPESPFFASKTATNCPARPPRAADDPLLKMASFALRGRVAPSGEARPGQSPVSGRCLNLPAPSSPVRRHGRAI